ncbi:MAG: 2-C-methyl-D-erythritol 4-phosphate cytidylyltransferase [Bacteroidaceae bacterium]
MNSLLVVAGGKGVRMGSSLPKQFLEIAGMPVLMRTILNFYEFDKSIKIILVLPRAQQDYWRTLCQTYGFCIEHKIADGGETRFHSVKNGLALIDCKSELVMIHDGVRPFVSHTVLRECLRVAKQKQVAIPVISPSESIRQLVAEDQSMAVDRSLYRIVQTPQTFDVQLIKKAYEQPYCEHFTDDASVVERIGGKIELVEGNIENIKLTTPFDLKVAEVLLSKTY